MRKAASVASPPCVAEIVGKSRVFATGGSRVGVSPCVAPLFAPKTAEPAAARGPGRVVCFVVLAGCCDKLLVLRPGR